MPVKNSKSPMTRQKRNIYIRGKRTTINIENYLWDQLERIARAEGQSVDEICSRLKENYTGPESLSSVIRWATHGVTLLENPHLYAKDTDDLPDEMKENRAIYADSSNLSPFAKVLARLETL